MIFFLRSIEVLPINMTNHIFTQKILCLLHAIDLSCIFIRCLKYSMVYQTSKITTNIKILVYENMFMHLLLSSIARVYLCL